MPTVAENAAASVASRGFFNWTTRTSHGLYLCPLDLAELRSTEERGMWHVLGSNVDLQRLSKPTRVQLKSRDQ